MPTYLGSSGLVLLPGDKVSTAPSGLQTLTRSYACRSNLAGSFRALFNSQREENYLGQTFFLYTFSERSDGVFTTFDLNCYSYVPGTIYTTYSTELRSVSWTVGERTVSGKYLAPIVSQKFCQQTGMSLNYVSPSIPSNQATLFELTVAGFVFPQATFQVQLTPTIQSETQSNYGKIEEVELKFSGIAVI